MAEYRLRHPDAAATRAHMEQIVHNHGNITIKDYKIACLIVTADEKVMTAFEKRHPMWLVDKVVHAKPAPHGVAVIHPLSGRRPAP